MSGDIVCPCTHHLLVLQLVLSLPWPRARSPDANICVCVGLSTYPCPWQQPVRGGWPQTPLGWPNGPHSQPFLFHCFHSRHTRASELKMLVAFPGERSSGTIVP